MYCAVKGAFETGLGIHTGLSASKSTIFDNHRDRDLLKERKGYGVSPAMGIHRSRLLEIPVPSRLLYPLP
jgi:hypothetical protein